MEFGFVIAVALFALVCALFISMRIAAMDPGNEEMRRLCKAIYEGASAFLSREYAVLVWFVAGLAIVIALIPGMGWQTSLSFVVGSIASGLAGYLGMKTATTANARTTQAAITSMPAALRVAFNSGSVLGLSVVGLGLLGIAGLFLLFTRVLGLPIFDTLDQYILGF